MNHVIQVSGGAGALASPKCEPIPNEEPAEQRIEFRIGRLGDQIQGLVKAPFPGLFQESGRIHEALQELTTQYTTLVWTARVAKCTAGTVRLRLWTAIERALASLEKVADSLGQN
jgi:hypothetical protein